jgi:hypothetical protein
MNSIEERVFAGEHSPSDAQWIAFLSEIFADVSLAEFIGRGLSASDARRLLALLALNARINNPNQPQ